MRFARTHLCYVLLAILIIAGVFIRAWPVAIDRPIWSDEACTWEHSQNVGFLQVVTGRVHHEHPPLSYLFVHLMQMVFGIEKFWAMRLPSLVFGSLCIPAAFLLGRVIHSDWMGVWIAALSAADPNMIDQGQQARMYSLFMLLLLLILIQAVWIFRKPRETPWPTIRLGILLGLLVCTHHVGWAIWPAVAVAMAQFAWSQTTDAALRARILSASKPVLYTFCTATLVALPCVAQLIRRLGHDDRAPMRLAQAFASTMHNIGILLGDRSEWLLIGAAVGLVYLSRRSDGRSLAVMCVGVVSTTILIQFPISQNHHFLSTRYMLPIAAVAWLGLAALIVFPKQRWVRAVMCMGVIFGMSPAVYERAIDKTFDVYDTKYSGGAAVHFIISHRQSDELVVFLPKYWRRLGTAYQHFSDHPLDIHAIGYRSNYEASIVGEPQGEGIWVLLSGRHLRNAETRSHCDQTLRDVTSQYGASWSLDDLPQPVARSPLIVHVGRSGMRAWQCKIRDGRASFEPIPAERQAYRGTSPKLR